MKRTIHGRYRQTGIGIGGSDIVDGWMSKDVRFFERLHTFDDADAEQLETDAEGASGQVA